MAEPTLEDLQAEWAELQRLERELKEQEEREKKERRQRELEEIRRKREEQERLVCTSIAFSSSSSFCHLFFFPSISMCGDLSSIDRESVSASSM